MRGNVKEEGSGRRDAEDKYVSNAAKKKLKDSEEPALSINAADGQENLCSEGDPERRDHPAGESAGDRSIQAESDEHDQHDREISEAVNVQGVNEMIDVEDALTHVKHLEHQREKRNTAQHHVGKVAEQRCDKEGHLAAVLAHFLFGPLFHPLLAFVRRRFVELHQWSEITDWRR